MIDMRSAGQGKYVCRGLNNGHRHSPTPEEARQDAANWTKPDNSDVSVQVSHFIWLR